MEQNGWLSMTGVPLRPVSLLSNVLMNIAQIVILIPNREQRQRGVHPKLTPFQPVRWDVTVIWITAR